MSTSTEDETVAAAGKKEKKRVDPSKEYGNGDKVKIEKLLDSRRNQLDDRLSDLKQGMNNAIKDMIQPEVVAELDELKSKMAQLELDKEQLEHTKDAELNVLFQALSEEFEEKLERWDKYRQKLKDRNKEQKNAISDSLNKKFDKKEKAIVEQICQAQSNRQKLERQIAQEKALREIAVQDSFSKMREELGDIRNKAVEELWTEVIHPAEAKELLERIPDACAFRKTVTVPLMLQQLGEGLRLLGPSVVDKLQCPKCGGYDVRAYRHGELYCNACYSTTNFGEKILALPEIGKIATLKGEQNEVGNAINPVLQNICPPIGGDQSTVRSDEDGDGGPLQS